MAGKKGTTTQPGDFSKDRIERILAEARGEAQTVPLVSRAPKPLSPLRFHPKLTRPKPTQMPRGWEQYFPGDLIALTTVIIGKAIREFSDQTKTLPLCKYVVSELTPHLCARVQRKTLQADEALSKMSNVLHCLSVYNCDNLEASYRVEQDTIGSDEWLKLAKEMARVPSAAANDSSRLAPAQPPPATVANGGGRERGAATKKSIRPVRGKGGRRRVPREKSKAYHWANEVKKVLPKFREGYKLLRQFKAAYPAQKAVWERELSGRQYLPLHIGALIESNTPGAAACRYVANRDGLKLGSIQNAYSRCK